MCMTGNDLIYFIGGMGQFNFQSQNEGCYFFFDCCVTLYSRSMPVYIVVCHDLPCES